VAVVAVAGRVAKPQQRVLEEQVVPEAVE